MISHFTWLVVTYLAGQGLAHSRGDCGLLFETPSLHYVVEGDENRSLPKNIALSRRAYDFGLYFYRKRDLRRAREAMDAALRFDPSYPLAYAARCTVRSEMGDHRGAIEDASRAIDLDPNMADAYFNRGVAFGRLREWGNAVKDYTEALRLAPKLGNGMAHSNLGSALMAKGKLDAAIDKFSKAIELNPKNAFALFNRSLAYERAGRLDHAMADLNATLDLAGTFIEAHHRRAMLFATMGLNEQAIEDLNTAIRLYPKDLVALADRALLHERLGNSDAAAQDFQRFSELSGEDPRKIDREKHLGSSAPH